VTPERLRNKRATETAEGGYRPVKRMRFGHWGERWLGMLERKPATVASYRSTIAYASETFGERHVSRVPPTEISQLSRRLRDQGLSDSTRAQASAHARRLLRLCGRARVCG
jgi:hypothetical protein